MGFFNEFPHTRTYDNDLGWLIKKVKDLDIQLQNFIKLNTVKYADPIIWNITTQYEANTIVIDGNTGTAYISTKPVPSGVSLTNTYYWTPIFTLNLLSANQNITFRDDATNVVATFESATGDWLLWNFYLYRVMQPISVNTAYVEGFNIERFSVELFIRDYINTLATIIGDLDDLTTSDKTSIVDAINSLLTDISTIIGDLDDLTTSDKTTIVDAINSLLTDINTSIGDLDDLNTSDTSSIVNSINSVNDDLNSVKSNLRVLSSFSGATDTDKLLDAIANGTGVILDKDITLNNFQYDRKETFYIFGNGYTISMSGKFESIHVYGQDLYFLDCVFDGTNGGYFDVNANYLVDVRFHNCKFVNFTHDIFVGTLQMFSFLNCYFKGNSGWIINTSRIDAVWINNSNFEGGYGFLYCSGACYNLSIRDSIIESATNAAVIIDGGGSDVIFDTVYLEDNTVNFKIAADYAGNYTITNIHGNIKTSTTPLVEVYKNNISAGQYGQINVSNSGINQGIMVKLGDTTNSYYVAVKNCNIAGNVNANMFDVSSIVSKANQAVRSKEIQFLQYTYTGVVSSGGQWINLYNLVPELNQHVLLSAYIQAAANVTNYTTQLDPGGSIRLYGDGVNASVYDLVITYC